MPSSKWTTVKGWLVDTFPTLTSMATATTFDGPPVTRGNPQRFVTVGFVEDDNAGTFSQQSDYDGSVRSEVGEVRSKIVWNSGSSATSSTEGAAFAVVNELSGLIEQDQTLGNLLSPEATAFLAVDVLQLSNARGTATELVLTLRYTTTL